MSQHSVIVQWSEEDQTFIASVPELPGLSAFGETQEEALRELNIAKEAFLDVMREDSQEIPEPDLHKPFSGQIRVRLPKSLHAALSEQAKKEGVSLNTHIVQLLSERNAIAEVRTGLARVENRIHTFMLMTTPTVVTQTSAEAGHMIRYVDKRLDAAWGWRD